jgi:hypothetical protein
MKAKKLLHKAEQLAHMGQNANGLLLIHRLGTRLLAEGSPQWQYHRACEVDFYAQICALPRPSFSQILEGDLGPGPWEKR